MTASEWGTGSSGLRITDADIVSITQNYSVVPNQSYELHLSAAWKISLDNRIYIHATWLDSEGDRLSTQVPLRLPLGQVLQPVDIIIPFSAPKGSSQVLLRIIASRQYPDDHLDIIKLDFGTVY